MGTLYDLLTGTQIPGAGNRFWNWASKVSLAIDEGGGGGGCGIKIPAGGTISGTYNCDVLCLGNVTASGNVTVHGSLKVLGDITNTGGYALTVSGDLYANYLFFTKSNLSTPQSDISVGGDLLCIGLDFPQCGDMVAKLTVGGDLIARPDPAYDPDTGNYGSFVRGYGITPSANGSAISVFGDLIASFVTVVGGPGGNGGSVDVHGSLIAFAPAERYDPATAGVYAGGGDSDAVDNGPNGGSGGYIYVRGDMAGTNFSVNGGSATGSNSSLNDGGDAGVILCDGAISVLAVYANGGNCSSPIPTASAGRGGYLTVLGDAVVADALQASGGARTGTVTGSGVPSRVANGGWITVHGNLTSLSDISLNGGEATSNFSDRLAVGGNGGLLRVYGSLVVRTHLSIVGGDTENGNAGNAGTLFVQGNADISIFNAWGGDSDTLGNGGSGPAQYQNRIRGYAVIGELDSHGGEAAEGSGGSGGYLEVEGTLTFSGGGSAAAYFHGGNSASPDSSDTAGKGGSLTCNGLVAYQTSIYVSGGDRSGTTSGSPVSNTAPDAGQVIVQGDATLKESTVYAVGGTISTAVANGPGGNGGDFIITGTLSADPKLSDLYDFVATGGDTVGAAVAGRGGSLNCTGHASIRNVNLSGGDAAAPGTNGYAGSAYFYAGVSCQNMVQLDGSGSGTVPTSVIELVLRGYCSFYSINMQDRGGALTATRIRGEVSNSPAILKVLSMPSLSKLWRSNNTLTPSVSGSLDDSIFVAGANAGVLGWYTVPGIWTV